MKQVRHILYKQGQYEKDVSIVKEIGNYYKFSNLVACRRSGIEVNRKYSPKGTINTQKLENNLSRARSAAIEIALANDWEYMATFTLNKAKHERYGLKGFQKDLSAFIRNYNRNCTDEEKVRYMLIPEPHADGAWHMHGFIRGMRKEDVFINQNGYLSWRQYHDKFGFSSLSKIRSIDNSSKYILKYITQDLAYRLMEAGDHLYYCSTGLKRGVIKHRGSISLKCPYDYEREDGLCKVKWFDTRLVNPYDYMEFDDETECSL